MEHQIGVNGQHGIEWQIVLTENEAVIVRRAVQLVEPAKASIPVSEPAPMQAASSVRSAGPTHPRIYANMR